MTTHASPPHQRAHGERGAIAILFAMALTALVMAGALAIDVTNVSRSTRDLQGLADVIALDLARYVDGRSHADIDGSGEFQGAWARVKADNGITAGGARTATYTLGNWTAGTFTPTGAAGVPDAVLVRVGEFVEYGLGRISGHDGRSLSRDAIASRVGRAQFTIGSVGASATVGNFSNINAALASFLGNGVNFDLLGYNGLASTRISLAALATELGFASPEEMAKGSVTAAALMQASARALGHPGNPPSSCNAAATSAATALFAASYCSRVATHGNIALGSIFSITQGTDGGASNTTINAGSLLGATAHIINGSNFASIPSFNAGVPGLTSTARVQVIKPPSGTTAFARPGPPCDPDAGAVGNFCKLKTEQIDYDSTHTISTPVLLATPLPVPLGSLPLEIFGTFTINTKAANADVTLRKAVCRHPNNTAIDDYIDTDVTSVPLTHTITPNLTVRIAGGGVPIANLLGPITHNETAPANTLNFIHDPADPSRNEFQPDGGPKRSGNSLLATAPKFNAAGLSATLTADAIALIPPGQATPFLNALKNDIYNVYINPTLVRFDTVANNILDNIKIHIGGADVWADSLQCENRTPTLVE